MDGYFFRKIFPGKLGLKFSKEKTQIPRSADNTPAHSGVRSERYNRPTVQNASNIKLCGASSIRAVFFNPEP